MSDGMHTWAVTYFRQGNDNRFTVYVKAPNVDAAIDAARTLLNNGEGPPVTIVRVAKQGAHI